jgi:Fe2+ or Zn2+ uptake regulation protein
MTNRVGFDTAETGLRAVLKDYQEIALRVIWASPEGLGSRAVCDRVNVGLQGETISRASIINFLEAMREAGVLRGVEKTGKGGHRWIYSPAMDEQQYKQYLAKTIIESLMRDFPEETRATLENLRP